MLKDKNYYIYSHLKTIKMSQTTKTASSLMPGEVTLESVRKLSGGKLYICVAEKIKGISSNKSTASLFNSSDSRFSTGVRKAWQPVERVDFENATGYVLPADSDLSVDASNPTMLNIFSPKLTTGEYLKIEITETQTPDEYQASDVEKTAKRAGKDGELLMKNGSPIWSNTVIVFGDAAHTLIQHDTAENASLVEEELSVATDEIND